QDDDARGITMLFLDANLDASGFGTLPKPGQIFEPLARTPGERNGGPRGVKDEQPGVAEHGKGERAIERPLARLLEIDGAQNAGQCAHVASATKCLDAPRTAVSAGRLRSASPGRGR